jgi:AraC-like DNA-binding protein/mannose-6-phosphate isomerase-like protein (cupin superfamily)
MAVARRRDTHRRKTDMYGKSERRQDYERTMRPIVAMAKNYPNGLRTTWHSHPRGQLVYAAQGVMTVSTETGQWTIPATRGVWIPANIKHSNRMYGVVRMRTLYIEERDTWKLPKTCVVLTISPLLRELILQAVRIKNDYELNSRDARLMRLIVDEIRPLQVKSFDLPFPAHPRGREIAQRMLANLSSSKTVTEWAQSVGISSKTLERLFIHELGITVGRWQQEARLQASLPCLAQGKGILETALSLGYASPSAFSAAFRKYFGTSPSTYFYTS